MLAFAIVIVFLTFLESGGGGGGVKFSRLGKHSPGEHKGDCKMCWV